MGPPKLRLQKGIDLSCAENTNCLNLIIAKLSAGSSFENLVRFMSHSGQNNLSQVSLFFIWLALLGWLLLLA